jgi:protease IV
MSMLGRVFRSLWRFLDGLRKVLHLLLLLALLAIVLVASRQPLPLVASGAALVVKPEGRLVEQQSGSAWERSLGALSADHEPETLVRDLVEAIHAAASDRRIKALVIDTSELTGGGLTKLAAVADAVAEFRKSGKRVLAWGDYLTQEQYLLAAQADELYLEPTGALGVVGFAAYGLYFRDALDRLGVDINVFRVGTHKSATEPFTRQDMSPEDRAQTEGWLRPLWLAYEQRVEGARKLPEGSVERYVREAVPGMRASGGDAALYAEQRGLITGRETRLQFEQRVAALVGTDTDTHSFNGIEHGAYLAATRPKAALKRHPAGQVAVLVAAGVIMGGERPPGQIGGQSLAALLRKARFDADVKAVVLRIDSGGGSVAASEQIRQEVAALKAAGKPVVASFASVAASGGYYIAMESDRIVAEPTTITGSIGVFGLLPTFQKTLGKLGIGSDGVATSSLAGAMHLERSLDPEAKQVLQLGVENTYRDFVARVAAARKRSPADVDVIAQGRVWIGADAQRLGLVDELGGVDAAVKAAAGLAKLREGEYGVSWREKELTWRETLLRQMRAEGLAAADALGLVPREPAAVRRVVGALERELGSLAAFDDPRSIYYYCGCDLR